jgi:hypothetical protein
MKPLRALIGLIFLTTIAPAFAMSNSSPPPKFPIPWAASASGSYVRTIPTASQVGIQNGAASLTTGFPPLTFLPISAGGVPPYGQDMNGILKQITQWNQWQNAGGTVSYDGTFSTLAGGYPLNAILAAANSGNFWLNSADANITNPDAGGAGWLGFSPVYPYVIDAGSANAGSATLPITISSLATVTGRPISIKKTSSANTTAYSVALNGYTAFVHHADGTSLNSGDLPGGGIFTVIYDGTYFQLQSPVVSQTLGTAASKNATSAASSYVSSVIGSTTNQHIAIFSDGVGSITDSGWNINQLAPLNSPAFVGSPTSITQVTSDNSTKLATDEFVNNAISAATPFPVKGYILFTTSGGIITSVTASSTALASNFFRVSTGYFSLLSSAMPATTIGWFVVQSQKNAAGATAESDNVCAPSSSTYTDGSGRVVWGFLCNSLAKSGSDPAKALILIY